jgi:carbamoyltransferase
MAKYYVGLSATLHDPALAIVDGHGDVLFAEATERGLQNKRAFNAPPDDLVRLPGLLRRYCQDPSPEFVAAVTWSTPFQQRLEFMAAAGAAQPAASLSTPDIAWPGLPVAAMGLALRNSLSQATLNLAASWRTPGPVVVRRYDHHLTHAATAALTGPFDECVVAVVDGYGEEGSTACYRFEHGVLTRLDGGPGSVPAVPASLGHFYSLVCAGCGFDPWLGEEWKVMGLAGYGRFDRDLYDLLRPLVTVEGLSLTSTCSVDDFSARVARLRECSRRARPPEAAADLAHTGQLVFEEVLTELLSNLYERERVRALAFAGGCALNSSYTGKIVQKTGFRQVHVPCAPADDGNAVGAALLACHEDHPDMARQPSVGSAYLGSIVSEESVERLTRYGGLRCERHGDAIAAVTAQALADGRIVGWVQGRAEFGPRALGNRSILADPRSSTTRARVNDHVKFREPFRPLAPSILDEHGDVWFEHYQTSPYMERALRFRADMAARVPAVVHVDGTGRVHSVRREWNERFWAVIAAFHRLTGVPIVLNTSFNVMGKPIIHSVEDAIAVFLTSDIDCLVIDGNLWRK